MQNHEKVRSVRRQKKQDTATSKDQPVQEVQKDKVDSASANLSAESEKQQHATDRVHTLQQNKPDHHNERIEGNMETYQKLKCVYCGYEMASKAKKPKCYKCGHRKFNRIPEFTVTKPYKMKGGVNMTKEKEAEKPEEKKKEVQEDEADELDSLFD